MLLRVVNKSPEDDCVPKEALLLQRKYCSVLSELATTHSGDLVLNLLELGKNFIEKKQEAPGQ